MQTYDVTRDRRDLYAPKPGDLALVDVPEMGFLTLIPAGPSPPS